MYASFSKLSKELKSGIEILVGQRFLSIDQNSQNNIRMKVHLCC